MNQISKLPSFISCYWSVVCEVQLNNRNGSNIWSQKLNSSFLVAAASYQLEVCLSVMIYLCDIFTCLNFNFGKWAVKEKIVGGQREKRAFISNHKQHPVKPLTCQNYSDNKSMIISVQLPHFYFLYQCFILYSSPPFFFLYKTSNQPNFNQMFPSALWKALWADDQIHTSKTETVIVIFSQLLTFWIEMSVTATWCSGWSLHNAGLSIQT